MGTAREVRIEHFAPTRPNAAMIELIHRDHDEYVTFARVLATWDQGPNVPARELDRWMPELRPFVEVDGYFSINGMFGGARWKSRWISALPGGRRSVKSLQYLTACFVDLDLYKRGLEVDSSVEQIRGLESLGVIPQVSIWLRSGRGIWLLWLLRSREGEGPIRARDALLPAFRAIQGALADRLVDYAPDASARDPARVTRIPGSLNGKAGVRVAYDLAIDVESGKPIAYRLDDLATSLGVDPNRLKRARIMRSKNPHVVHGKKGHNRRALHGLLRLARLRNLRKATSFQVGMRHNAALMLATFMRFAGFPRPTVIGVVANFFRTECAKLDADGRPDPIEPEQHRILVDHVFATQEIGVRFRAQKIADLLDITPAEAAALYRFETGSGVPWPAASRFRVSPPPRKTKHDRLVHKRRERIARFVRDRLAQPDGRAPSLREVQKHLVANGLKASHETVRADLTALGIATRVSTRGSPTTP